MALQAKQTDQDLRLTKRWYPLYPHPVQIAMRDSTARFIVNPAGRRSGKTERKKRKLVQACMDVRSFKFDDPIFVAAAPTYSQAKSIWWRDLKAMMPKWMLAKRPSETDLRIDCITGATLKVMGLDKPERIEGTPLDGIVIDEIANTKPESWEENILPALTDRAGWAELIGVPEGRNFYYDMWKDSIGRLSQENGGNWAGFTWHSADIIDPEVIEYYRSIMDPLTFAQEYEASFVNFTGQAYYPFKEETHCTRLRQNYNPRGTLIFMLDFNVDPGVAAIAQEMQLPEIEKPLMGIEVDGRTLFSGTKRFKAREGTGIIGEVYIPRNSNTPAVCRKLIDDWGDHQGHIAVYGDATGGARTTASETGSSDWDLVKQELYKHYGPDRVSIRLNLSDNGKPMNPSERSRVNAVNSRLLSDAGIMRLMVDPASAPMTVKDFEGVRLLEGGSGEIDKKHDQTLTHLTDAVGYYIVKKYPVRRDSAIITELSR
jgi:hypothetical protein